jgi:hypothetical protein
VKLNTPTTKRLVATGILALGVGSYQLMAGYVPCETQTANYCRSTVCNSYGGYGGYCYVYITGPIIQCYCNNGQYHSAR